MSDEIRNEFGVPQGTKLAAILFILYINDIKSCLLFAMLILFADDNLLYVKAKNMGDAFEKINKDLERVNKWLNLNKLKLNVNKCKYVVINKSYLQNEEVHKGQIDGIEIEKVEEYKYLGFVLDSKLKLKKVAKKIGFLTRIGNKLTKYDKITLCNIAPHFQCCASVSSMFNAEESKNCKCNRTKP